MNLSAGDVFVHRNLANIIPNTDLNAMAAIEYAVAHLHIKHIIVCGHYDCSGVKAALSPRDMGILNPWLRNIRDAYRLHEAELDRVKDEELKFRRLCEINVLESARNVVKTAMVQKAYYEHAYPIVHAWIFDMKNGTVKDLELDFWGTLMAIAKIYNLESEVKATKSAGKATPPSGF